MSTLQELIDDVVADTRRPDRETDITRYVRKTVRHAHALRDFDLDLTDTTLTVTGGSEVTIGSAPLPDFFRKVKVLRPLVSGSFISGVSFKKTNPQYIAELAAEDLTLNTYYITQSTLHFESETAISSMQLMFYTYPDLTDLNNSTWITENFPEALVDMVKAQLYAALGDVDSSRRLMQDWTLFAQDIVNSQGA